MAGGNDSIYELRLAQSGLAATDMSQRLGVAEAAADEQLATGIYWRLKRPLGFLAGLLVSVLTLPLICLIALKLAHEGRPVFIRRRRLGRNGKPFTALYFRTMVPDSLRALQAGSNATPAQDGFGRFLARSRLDHLPLFWNVLRGDMTLVGPRPLSQEELIGRGRAARHTLSVRPGVTGLWWTEAEPDLRRRLALDRSYIEHASLLLDLRIVLRSAVLIHSGGFQQRRDRASARA